MQLKDGERLYSKNWSGSTSLRGFAREIAAWLGYFDPKNEAKKYKKKKNQRITIGTLRATEDGLTVVTLKMTSLLNWTMSWRWPWPV